MDYLWTPWRYQYISEIGATEGECVFCRLPQFDEADVFIVLRGEYNYIVLNKFPYTSGHCMIIPYRHFGLFSEIRPEEMSEMMALAQLQQCALTEIYRPEGFNIGWNQGRCAGAGVADHIHLHIVPRWVGDSNLVGVIGETRTLPEDLKTTWTKLKLHFDERRGNRGP